MKVFQISDTDWWAAETAEQATAAAMNWVDCTDAQEFREDFNAYPVPAELSQEDMDRLNYTHEDDATGEKSVWTFQQQLDRLIAEGRTFPIFFATTEN